MLEASAGGPAGGDSRTATAAHPRTWLARWLETNSELRRLHQTSPMLDVVVDAQDGRRLRVGDHWLVDFASCNYLDAELASLLGAEDALTLPTITHIHSSVLPALADQGTVYLDARAHKTIWDGCQIARGRGATVRRFAHDDPGELERLLRAGGPEPRVVCTDGINSMTGNPPPLREYLRLARAYDALLYLDDGHGFGVIGERAPDEPCPYGRRGNGLLRHLGESYDHVVYVGGCSKAYSSLLAFHPGVPRSQVGFRLQLTAANTDQHVDLLTDVLRDLATRYPLRPADEPHTLVLP